MKLIFLLLFSTSVLALKPHTAIYDLSILGLKIANETRILSEKNGIYHYVAHAQTTWPTSLIKDYQIDAESSFTINQFGVRSIHYKYFERDGKEIKRDIDIMLKNQQIDLLSLFLALSSALANNSAQTDFYFTVNDGKKVKQHHYQQMASEDNKLIKIVNLDKHIEAYFAKDKDYLPVLINKKKFSYKLKNVTFTK